MSGVEVKLYRVRVRQEFEYAVDVLAASKAQARGQARVPSTWKDWDEAGNWIPTGPPRTTRDPVEDPAA